MLNTLKLKKNQRKAKIAFAEKKCAKEPPNFLLSQLTLTYSKSTVETLEKGLKYVQSRQ